MYYVKIVFHWGKNSNRKIKITATKVIYEKCFSEFSVAIFPYKTTEWESKKYQDPLYFKYVKK